MPKKEDVKKTVNETVKDENVAAAKEAAAKATEAVKEAAKSASKVVEEKAKEAEKAVAKKTTAAKKTVKKAASKAAAKVVEASTKVVIQYQNNENTIAQVEERVKAQFIAEGHRASSIKQLDIYVKPEEYSAYYVINEKFSGRVDLF